MLQARIAPSVGISPGHGGPCAGKGRLVQAERSGACRACGALRARGAWRYPAHRHQEARFIVRPSHRVTGNRKDSVAGAGWERLFVAIDDRGRIAFTAIRPDEKKGQAVQFLRNAVAYSRGWASPSSGC